MTVSVLVLSLGLHWTVLQSIAWTGMIISYSSNVSFKEAVAKTFDGKHPCSLCKAIAKGQAGEKQQDTQSKSSSKQDFGLVWQAMRFNLDFDQERIPVFDFSGVARGNEPPKPRPRAVLDHRACA